MTAVVTTQNKIIYPAAHQVTATHLNPIYQAFLSAIDRQQDPSSFAEAVQSQIWCDAMNVELQALEMNGTWSLTKLPVGKKAIGCKWLFKTKYRSDGTIERHKARLVIQGCRQQKGIDYEETFAPVAKMTIVRSVLAVASIQGWQVWQMDVTNAFLHGDLEEDVYMKLPQGYRGQGEPILCSSTSKSTRTIPSNTVCKLHKPLSKGLLQPIQ